MISWELKKIFNAKTVSIVLALLIFLLGITIFLKPTLETENIYRNDRYELIEDTRSKEEIAGEKFNEKIHQLEEVVNISEDNPFTNKLKNTAEEYLSSMKYREYKDVDFYKVFNYRVDHPFMSIIIVIILVLIFSNIYTDEIISGVDNIILSSKNKFKTLYSKLALAIIIPIVIYGLYLGVVFLITLVQYGMPVNGELEAFRIVDIGTFFYKAYTIIEYLTLKVATITVIFISIAVFASFFSFISTNSLTSISATLIFIGIGKVLTVIKFLPSSLLIILSKVNYINLIFYPDGFIGIYAGEVDIFGKSLDVLSVSNGILVSMIFLGVALCVFAFKKLLTR